MRPKLLALASAAFLLTACMDEAVRPKANLPVDSDVLVGLSERLPERSLVLACRTSREYPCVNYRLDATLTQVPNALSIRFKQVIAPVICATAIGPARVEFELAPLRPGTLDLELQSELGALTGQLAVNEGAYVVTAQPGAVAFPEPVLQRIPAGTVWGFFGYARADLEPKVREIINEMKSLGGTDATLHEGRYSVMLPNHQGDEFLVNASGALDYGSMQGYYHLLPLALSYSGENSALRDLVASVGQAHGDAVHLRIYTSTGDAYLSWLR